MSMGRGGLLGRDYYWGTYCRICQPASRISNHSCTRLDNHHHSTSILLHASHGIKLHNLQTGVSQIGPWVFEHMSCFMSTIFLSLHSRTIMLLKDDESTLLVFKFVWEFLQASKQAISTLFAVVLRA
jgi:hypothetical protein